MKPHIQETKRMTKLNINEKSTLKHTIFKQQKIKDKKG